MTSSIRFSFQVNIMAGICLLNEYILLSSACSSLMHISKSSCGTQCSQTWRQQWNHVLLKDFVWPSAGVGPFHHYNSMIYWPAGMDFITWEPHAQDGIPCILKQDPQNSLQRANVQTNQCITDCIHLIEIVVWALKYFCNGPCKHKIDSMLNIRLRSAALPSDCQGLARSTVLDLGNPAAMVSDTKPAWRFPFALLPLWEFAKYLVLTTDYIRRQKLVFKTFLRLWLPSW